MSSTTLRNQVSARQPHAGDWDDGHIAVGRAILVCAAMLLGCQETEQAQLVRALALSDDIAFLCRDYDSGQGARLDECPDRVDDGIRHELLALVTQPLTAEVAVLSFSQGKVLDGVSAAIHGGEAAVNAAFTSEAFVKCVVVTFGENVMSVNGVGLTPMFSTGLDLTRA